MRSCSSPCRQPRGLGRHVEVKKRVSGTLPYPMRGSQFGAAGESQTNNSRDVRGRDLEPACGAPFSPNCQVSSSFKSIGRQRATTHFASTFIQREMGAADNEEVPVVSTELYHKDFDAFVKVRSPRFPPTLPTLFRWGVPSFFVSPPGMPSLRVPDRPLSLLCRRSVRRMRNTAS